MGERAAKTLHLHEDHGLNHEAAQLIKSERQLDALHTAYHRCQWYAMCLNEATGTLNHPILGEVPICDRCRAKDEALR